MYTLKQLPEDFIVTEVSNIKVKEQGRYAYFKLKKTNRNTLDCVKEIARQLNIKEKEVGFAGSKDKNAVTSQLISLKSVSKEKISKIKLDHAVLELVGFGNEPISLGDLSGNWFEIIVRNLENVKIDQISFVENYFDEQRFSKNNVNIGRYLIKKEFKEAVKLIEDQKVKGLLKINPHDAIGALKQLPKRLLRMYVNAYQSYLWNETLKVYLEQNCKVVKKVTYSQGELVFVDNPAEIKELKIPLIGFNDDLVTEETKDIIQELMKTQNLDFSDFVIKQIPELSLEGELRDAFVEIKDLTIGKLEIDELNLRKNKVKISFSLGKGSYATMVVRKLLNTTQ